tara:strand:+ start:47 stop:220 length:174 start_codon:yes stop_codon:yes gene_type:complete
MEQKYTMSIKSKTDKASDIVWTTEASSLSEAKQYFVKLKDLDEKSFDKIFIVTKKKK